MEVDIKDSEKKDEKKEEKPPEVKGPDLPEFLPPSPKKRYYRKPVAPKSDRKFKDENIKVSNARSARPKKTKGRTQAIIDILRKNVAKYGDSPPNIKQFLDLRESIRVSDDDATFYSKLLMLTYNNVRLNITDVLGPRQFTCIYRCPDFFNFPLTHNIFTNDKLYWVMKIYNQYKTKNFRKTFVDNDIYIMLCSSQIYISNTETYKKGYIQDYNKNFSYIGKDTFTQYDISIEDVYKGFKDLSSLKADYKNKFDVKSSEFVEMKFNNIEYEGYIMSNGAFLCYTKGLEEAKVKKMMESEQLIEDKRNSKESLKIIEVSKKYDGINAFISQKIKLSDFVPGIVELPSLVGFSYFAYIPISMAALDELVGENIQKDVNTINALFGSQEIVQLNNFDLFINYLNLLLCTRLKDKKTLEKVRKIIEEALSQYNSYYRLDMSDIKKKISDAQTFLLKFYDSFYNKINVDTCLSLSRTFESKIRDVAIYLNDHAGYIQNINTNFIVKYGMNIVCGDVSRKFANVNLIVNALGASRNALENIRLGLYSKLESELRGAGKKIYDLMNTNVFDEFRSPNLFLGDVEIMEEAMASFKEGEIKKDERIKAEDDKSVLRESIDSEKAFKLGLAYIIGFLTTKTLCNMKTQTYDDSIQQFLDSFSASFKKDMKNSLAAGAKNVIVDGDDNLLQDLIKKNKDFFDEAVRNFIPLYEKLYAKEAPKFEGGDGNLVKGSDFTMNLTIKSYSKVPSKTLRPDPKATGLGINEIVTEQLLENMNVLTYPKLVKSSVDQRTLDAWRARGITDDVLYAFYTDLIEKPKGKIPLFGDYFAYAPSMQKITQEKHGRGVGGDLGSGGSSDSTDVFAGKGK